MTTPIPDCVASRPARGPALARFAQFAFEHDGWNRPVYYSGDRNDPAILVMPEIAGFAPGLRMFAERLAAARYQVYVPWLFGKFGQRASIRNAIRLCISREFANLRGGIATPAASWLRALAGHVSRHNGDANIGVIGMYLTGAFAIPLVLDPRVVAAVASQPAIPCTLLFALLGIRRPSVMRELNVSNEDIESARGRLASGAAHLLGVRHRADRFCPAEKLQRLREEFPQGLVTREYGSVDDRNLLGDRPHAIFTKEFRLLPNAPPEHPPQQAFTDLLNFFDVHLRGRVAAGTA